jgi:tetratricopeptide (TPR) repeat protein
LADSKSQIIFRLVGIIMLNIIDAPGPTEEHPDKEQVQRLFADGLAFHRQDRLEHATAAYEQVLKLMPGHIGALRHVGIVAFQFGNYHIAAGFLRSAIAIDPALPAVHCDLGNAYKELGQNDDALHAYGCALALDANHLDAGFNRAITLHEMQRYDEALEAYDQIIASHGEDAALLNNIGMILHCQNRHEQALASLDRALAIDAGYLDAQGNRCQVLEALKRFDEALAAYAQMIDIAPTTGESYVKRAFLHMRMGHPELALADADAAIRVAPDTADSHRIRGMALHALQRFPAAVDSYNAALRQNPADAAVYDQRGLALTAQRQFTLALASHERAIELDNNLAAAHLHCAGVLRDLGQLKSAAQAYARALDMHAGAEAFTGHALVLGMLGHDDAALEAYGQALALDPDYAPAYWHRSQLYLRNGQFEQGWKDFEWRGKAGTPPAQARALAAPRWEGSASLEGKTILLYAEHGATDTLHACRYVSLVAARGATVILEVPQALAGLLARLEGVSQLVVAGEPLPAVDFECPLPSLPFAFGTTLASIPSVARYLESDPDKVTHWAGVLGERTKPRIGIFWSASASEPDSAQRSIKLADFGRLFAADCQFVVLQTELNAIDRAVLGIKKNVVQPGSAVADLTDTAALCELMDVIVTIDSAVAHLAGALGKPAWVLLPVAADWRWLREREDSPWYPGAELYRQPLDGGWNVVLDKVGANLSALAAK